MRADCAGGPGHSHAGSDTEWPPTTSVSRTAHHQGPGWRARSPDVRRRGRPGPVHPTVARAVAGSPIATDVTALPVAARSASSRRSRSTVAPEVPARILGRARAVLVWDLAALALRLREGRPA